MKEDFLHYLWKYKLFNFSDLATTTGEKIELIAPGSHNRHSGPDFFNARLKIGDALWAGNVEIHVHASDWFRHNHHHDPAYENIILHVAWKADAEVFRDSGTKIPVVEMKDRIRPGVYARYLQFEGSRDWIPCQNSIGETPSVTITSTIEKLVAERLERKSEEIFHTMEKNKNDWNETFYQHLAKNFGFKINAVPFSMLASSLPFSLLLRHRDNPIQIEALLFGQAGMLEETMLESYPRILQNEYRFLQKKYDLQAMSGHLWKFMRLRPLNFPSVRIAQFARLFAGNHSVMSAVLWADDFSALRKNFVLGTSGYWEDHFRFNKPAEFREKKMGEAAIDNLIINTVSPFLFAYGSFHRDGAMKERAVSYLQSLQSEKNHIISGWEKCGLKVKSAWESQGLLQLKNEYCLNKKCLDCPIGISLLKRAESFSL